MNEFFLFSGSSYPDFSERLASSVGVDLGKMTSKKFACGETYVRFDESFRGKDVFLIQSGRTNMMNEDVMELLFMIDAAKQSFANRIHIIMPYMPYARQDKIHEAREGISAKILAKMLETAGADHIITTQLHSDQLQGFFNIPVDNLSPRRLFIDFFREKNITNPVVVSPDAGGAKNAKKFADALGMELAILHKTRPGHGQSVVEVIGSVAGKTPIIVDDIIDGGGTVIGAKEALIEKGANSEVYLCATHSVLSGNAVERFNEAGFTEIICTDSLPVPHLPDRFHRLSLAPFFGEVISHVASNKSVSELYM